MGPARKDVMPRAGKKSEAAGKAATSTRAATASTPVSARVAHQQEQGASAKQKASARTAAGSGSSQEQEGPTSSRRFTPAQQAVAEALLPVIKRPMRAGRQAMCAARLILVTNNIDTCPLLEMLPDQGPLPTVQQLEQRASDQLLKSLTELASQCAAAQCQPLEVFTRSLQCTMHRAAASSIAAKRRLHKRQQQKQPRPMPGWREACLQAAAHERVAMQPILADLVVNFLYVQKVHDVDDEGAELIRPYLDHMLPGRPQSATHLWKQRSYPLWPVS